MSPFGLEPNTTPFAMSGTQPRVLILGGTGFIARHLVKYLVENDLASKVRVADKSLPVTSYLSKEFLDLYSNPKVEFKQANLANPAHVKRAFSDDAKFNFVINLAGETKFGQTDEVYEEMVYKISMNCAQEAVQHGVEKYIEVSTAHVYDSSSKALKENAKMKPWTAMAKKKLKAEEDLKKIQGLPLVIVRPAIVYGPGDLNGIMPRIVVAATYRYTKDKMKLLWSGDLRINTVHVTDAARALWHLCLHAQSGTAYNLADKNETNQKKLNEILGEIFHIETGFHGAAISTLAATRLTAIVNTANDNHMGPWSDMCKEYGIKFTPLSPYLDKELLYNNALSIDGTAIEETGFEYKVPTMTKQLVEEEIKYFVELGLFPKEVLQ